MALVHRSDDPVGPVMRASNNLSEVARAEHLRKVAIARYQHGERNGHKEIVVDEAATDKIAQREEDNEH